jgi:hypothetical protein
VEGAWLNSAFNDFVLGAWNAVLMVPLSLALVVGSCSPCAPLISPSEPFSYVIVVQPRNLHT